MVVPMARVPACQDLALLQSGHRQDNQSNLQVTRTPKNGEFENLFTPFATTT